MENRRAPTPEEFLQFRRKMQNSGLDANARQKELLRFAGEKMDKNGQQELNRILQDKKAMQNLLQSPEAKQLMEKLRKQN